MTKPLPPFLRSYINSEQEKDIEHAQKQCKRLGLDYTEMRRIILAEMIEESRSLGKSWTPAAGSRPLSEERAETLYQLTEGRACYGVVVKGGCVVDCAPYGRKRWLGRSEEDLMRAGAILAAAHRRALGTREE